jgi:hypothetical protein
MSGPIDIGQLQLDLAPRTRRQVGPVEVWARSAVGWSWRVVTPEGAMIENGRCTSFRLALTTASDAKRRLEGGSA